MKKLIPLALCALLATAGCSASRAASTTDSILNHPEAAAAVSIKDFAGRNVAFSQVPQHIIALSNGEMDIIYALGGTLVGRPSTNGPSPVKEAQDVTQIGSTHEVDLERITLLKPDVVLGHYPMNSKDVPIIESIHSKMVLTSANSVEDIKRQITLFGEMLHKETKAAELIASIDDKLSDFRPSDGAQSTRTLIVYGAPGTYMAALPNSLSGNLLELAGGYNIASDFAALQSYPQYAQINTERVVQANPQLILIMTHGNPEEVKAGFLKEMQGNAAWNGIDAVKNNQVEILPSELFGTNPGTRVIDALDDLHELVEKAKQPT
ncbi:ABC transporter substrate-binding protein [Paenibacillus gorillae]|uniref:ABC transporter substrate-binding protein n=1 Tax=Paenibacillus gorillae TaxID=1243662 RepID=UPI0004B7B084|nr:ABC transporter substrate-binding protein [Paenibacillus gorillae]